MNNKLIIPKTNPQSKVKVRDPFIGRSGMPILAYSGAGGEPF